MLKFTDETSGGLTVYTRENTDSKPVVNISYSLPSNIEDVGLKEKHLYKIKNTSSSSYIVCNRSNSGTYSVSLSTTEPSASSTLENSVYFALYKDGNSGYFKLTPTNANYRGSKELWNTTEINYLYYDGSSVGISSSYNNSNKSSWYVVMHNDGKYFILNRYYPNIALNWFLGNPSVSTGEVSFSSVSHKWEFIPVGLDVPLIVQEDNYCGPASILQSLVFLNFQNSIAGSSYSEKQETISNYVMVDHSYSRPDWMLTYINSICYSNGIGNKYTRYTSDNLSFTDTSEGKEACIKPYIKNSLSNGYPVIAQVIAKKLDYYSVHNSTIEGHFIVVVGYDASANLYIVRDCDNASNQLYFGEFTVSPTSFGNAILSNGKSILCETM